MTTTIGYCKNVDFCRLAADRRQIQVEIADKFICPECSKPLVTGMQSASAKRSPAVALGAVALLVAGGGVLGMALLNRPRQPAPAVSAAVAQAAPGQAAPEQAAPEQAGPAQVARPVDAPTGMPQGGSTPAAEEVARPELQPQPALATMAAAPAKLHLLHINGGTIMTSHLMPKLAAAFLARAGDTDIVEHRDPEHRMTVVTGVRGPLEEDIEIESSSDMGSFAALGSGEAEMAASSTRADSDVSDRLSALGDMASEACEHIVALDGIALVVNPANAVAQLDLDQLRAIYRGAITDWSQVGGSPGAIHLFGRNKDSGTFHAFADTVLRRSPISAETRMSSDDHEIAASVAGDPGAIGFMSQAYAGQTKVLAIGPKGATPQKPTELSLKTEDYPLTRRFYLYTAAAPKNHFVRKFAEFAQSQAGQDVVASEGFVSLSLRRVALEAPVAAPLPVAAARAPSAVPEYDRYRQLLSSAQRLPVDFRFKPGSNTLDNRGLRDLDRVADLVTQNHWAESRLVLAGFADNTGAPATNMAIAKERADVVAAIFANRGMVPGVVEAFGAEAPVADNGTPDGRDKNRRVEVYLLSEAAAGAIATP